MESKPIKLEADLLKPLTVLKRLILLDRCSEYPRLYRPLLQTRKSLSAPVAQSQKEQRIENGPASSCDAQGLYL